MAGSGRNPKEHVSPAGRTEEATVIARWADDRVLLHLRRGTTLEAPVPPELRGRCDIGASAWVLLTPGDHLAAWGMR